MVIQIENSTQSFERRKNHIEKIGKIIYKVHYKTQFFHNYKNFRSISNTNTKGEIHLYISGTSSCYLIWQSRQRPENLMTLEINDSSCGIIIINNQTYLYQKCFSLIGLNISSKTDLILKIQLSNKFYNSNNFYARCT